MPICKPCREAAEGSRVGLLVPQCPRCERKIKFKLYRDMRLLYAHKNADGEWCNGAGGPPVDIPAWTGHDDCDGCPCQHRPRGSWKGTS